MADGKTSLGMAAQQRTSPGLPPEVIPIVPSSPPYESAAKGSLPTNGADTRPQVLTVFASLSSK